MKGGHEEAQLPKNQMFPRLRWRKGADSSQADGNERDGTLQLRREVRKPEGETEYAPNGGGTGKETRGVMGEEERACAWSVIGH